MNDSVTFISIWLLTLASVCVQKKWLISLWTKKMSLQSKFWSQSGLSARLSKNKGLHCSSEVRRSYLPKSNDTLL